MAGVIHERGTCYEVILIFLPEGDALHVTLGVALERRSLWCGAQCLATCR
jgi:hypothetical protein